MTNKVAAFIRPSAQTPLAGCLDDFLRKSDPGFLLSETEKLRLKVSTCMKLYLFVAHDLASWAWATLTVRHAWRIGFYNHAANLTSTLAMCILSLGILFGYVPKVDFFRPAYCLGNFQSPYSSSLEERFINLPKSILQERILEVLNSPSGEQVIEQVTNGNLLRLLRGVYLRSNKPHVLAKIISVWESRSPSSASDRYIYSDAYATCGGNLNQQDEVGMTLLMEKASNIYEVDKLLDGHVQAAQVMDVAPLNVRLHCAKGFDILCLLLLRIHPMGSSYYTYPPGTIYPNENEFEVKYFDVINKLIKCGAFIETLRFEEYRDFIQELASSIRTPTYSKLLEEGIACHNPYISRVANLLQDPEEELFKEDVLPHLLQYAQDLVRRKPRIEKLWLPVREKYLNEYVNAIFAAFRTRSETSNSEGVASSRQVLGGEYQITVIVAEYLMSAPAFHLSPTN